MMTEESGVMRGKKKKKKKEKMIRHASLATLVPRRYLCRHCGQTRHAVPRGESSYMHSCWPSVAAKEEDGGKVATVFAPDRRMSGCSFGHAGSCIEMMPSPPTLATRSTPTSPRGGKSSGEEEGVDTLARSVSWSYATTRASSSSSIDAHAHVEVFVLSPEQCEMMADSDWLAQVKRSMTAHDAAVHWNAACCRLAVWCDVRPARDTVVHLIEDRLGSELETPTWLRV